jgi:hypothetical protein
MGEMKNLEEAIQTALQAVESTPADHPDRATCLNNLGNTLESHKGPGGGLTLSI